MLSETYPVKAICRVLSLPRSTWYYETRPEPEEELVARINRVAAEFPTYGSRRVQHQLRRIHPASVPVGRRRVRRLMRELGLMVRRKPKKRRTTNSEHPFPRFENLVADLEVTRPHQVWVADLTYIRLGSGEFVYLAILLDVFTRQIVGWELGRGLGVELTRKALSRALQQCAPEIHHSDQGLQYAASDYITLLKEHGIRPSMAEVGHAEQNGYAERVIRTIKEEEVALNDYPDFETARRQLGRFIEDVYQNKRIHSALGYLTPAEFATRWAAVA